MPAKFRQQMYGEVIRGRKQIDRPEPTVPHLSGRSPTRLGWLTRTSLAGRKSVGRPLKSPPGFLQMSIPGAVRSNCVGGRTTYLEAGLAAEAALEPEAALAADAADAADAAANALAANMVASKTAITLVIFNFLELELSRTFFMHEGPLITAQPGRGLTQSHRRRDCVPCVPETRAGVNPTHRNHRVFPGQIRDSQGPCRGNSRM